MIKLKLKDEVDMYEELSSFNKIGKWLQYLKDKTAIAVHTESRQIINTGDSKILDTFYSNGWVEEVNIDE